MSELIAKPEVHQAKWSGFYKKTLHERQTQLKLVFPRVFTSSEPSSSVVSSVYVTPNTSPSNNDKKSFPINGLDENIADNMIENCVGTIGLPVGLALNFIINGKPIIIPMAIEEPSVIAGVSGAAKTVSAYNGFKATAPVTNIIVAQVCLLDISQENMNSAIDKISRSKSEIIKRANNYCDNMVKRGGGVLDINVRRIPRKANRNRKHFTLSSANFREWLVVHITIDVCNAMGANCASTVAEGVAPFLAELSGGRIGLRIVSNLNVERMSKASFRIPLPMLAYKSLSGKEVAARIIEAYEWAEVDPYRATTHNKGIMNGIDAVAIATGQDWRAIEAAVHAWACDGVRIDLDNSHNSRSDNSYRPLTTYWIEKDEQLAATGKSDDECLMFCGELELPIMVGTVGGVLKTNKVYEYNLGIMGNPNSRDLAMSMACIGLAQNFAALRALATEGIQRGHMSLHAKNVAIAAGCPPHAVTSVAQRMIEKGKITLSSANDLVEAHMSEQVQCVYM
ncbi:11801_t:CDS:2 [Funneliformis caledonium]|uniref:3-hydroxy-3-methylglutaryl coenzyme A reductase n=1 Tax=Funneliformis caledonium TaxID=1117310 RepID=A0A9N9BZT4_9GLOM|nr:11801_t:CDS:2 [Funneliformis caledonium]